MLRLNKLLLSHLFQHLILEFLVTRRVARRSIATESAPSRSTLLGHPIRERTAVIATDVCPLNLELRTVQRVIGQDRALEHLHQDVPVGKRALGHYRGHRLSHREPDVVQPAPREDVRTIDIWPEDR